MPYMMNKVKALEKGTIFYEHNWYKLKKNK